MAAPEYKIRIAADASGVRSGVKQAEGSLKSLSGELTKIKGLAAGALGFAGIGVGVTELVRVADQYGQITARLQLATKATGDFAEVQQLLRQSAQETRAPLGETVDLYSKLSPALQGLGRSSAQSVDVITTINQAIALSGASAEASQAALIQFGQALASGALRGDELNSIMEQTPALARAVADGLGVSIGQLRAMGAAGELTAERVVGALEKMSAKIGSDFNTLPITVGQAMTLLNNAFTDLIGEAGQTSNAMGGLARGISFVAEGVQSLSGTGETLRPLVEFVTDAVDGISRLFRIAGTGIAGYTVAIKQALGGDLDAALATYRSIGAEVQKILDEPLAAANRAATVDNVKAQADARLKIEQQLADETARLEALRAVSAGKANADILADADQTGKARVNIQRKALQEELKGTEALRNALRSAWQESIEGARKAREEAAKLLSQAGDARQSGVDQAQERRMRGMSDKDRDTAARRGAEEARSAASSAAARALIKAYEGDLKGAEKLAADAAKQAERAERFVDQIADDDTAANLLEELGRIREDAFKTQSKVKEQEAQTLQDVAAQQTQQIEQAEARIQSLRTEIAKPITLQADIAQAEGAITALQNQLANIKDKTITVTVNTVSAGALPAAEALPTGSFARGGFTGHGGKYQPAGIVHAGEHVMPQEIVRQPGMLAFLERLRMQGVSALRGYSAGGLVSNVNPGYIASASAPSAASNTPIVLQWPDGTSAQVMASRAVADQITQTFRKAALARGGRR